MIYIKKHINNTPDGAPIFIRLQVHPFDVIKISTFLDNFDRVIEYCRSVGNVEFKNIVQLILSGKLKHFVLIIISQYIFLYVYLFYSSS